MKIHYFQRYHSKENVITANTMLLLNRFYHYSPEQFFQFLKITLFEEGFEPEIGFQLQERHKTSVPDATIIQESFKIVVETKLPGDHFRLDQLRRHLESFGSEKYKVLLTLARDEMDEATKNKCDEFALAYQIRHVNLTFASLINAIQDILDERDQEMQDILDDYVSACEHEGVLLDRESWQCMWMALAGATLEFNITNNLYYNKEERCRRIYDYLGLYNQKAIRAVGKVCARFIASNEKDIKSENGSRLTQERKDKILLAMKLNPALKNRCHRYFFVEHFYETNYPKITRGAPMGGRKFNLANIFSKTTPTDMPAVDEIAKLLRKKNWL